jgi:hypothetical protein
MPEVLYKQIKGSKYRGEYEDIINDIVLQFEKCTSLTQRLQYEDINYIRSNERVNELYEKLENFVKNHFPDMIIPYNIQLGKYNKKELLELFKNMNFDNAENIEVATICLQEILDQSYEDGEYMKYFHLYKEAYDKINIDTLQVLSTYVHENYIRSACLIFLDSLKKDEPSNWLSTCNQYHEIYLKTMRIAHKADPDTLSHQFVECIADFLFIMSNSDNIEEYTSFNPFLKYSFCMYYLLFYCYFTKKIL